jgi:hypothetical protein
LVRDEEDEEDIPEEHVLEYAYMIHEYEILQGHDMIRKEEMRLEELIKALMKCNWLIDAFEANTKQVIKCYCPACPPDKCKFENTGMMMAHLREKSSKKCGRNEK